MAQHTRNRHRLICRVSTCLCRDLASGQESRQRTRRGQAECRDSPEWPHKRQPECPHSQSPPLPPVDTVPCVPPPCLERRSLLVDVDRRGAPRGGFAGPDFSVRPYILMHRTGSACMAQSRRRTAVKAGRARPTRRGNRPENPQHFTDVTSADGA